MLSLVSSVFTLSLIACDRFFGIVFAMKAHLTERKAHTFIILIWICSIGISVPLLFYRKQESRVWLNHVEVWLVLFNPSIWKKVSFCASEIFIVSWLCLYLLDSGFNSIVWNYFHARQLSTNLACHNNILRISLLSYFVWRKSLGPIIGKCIVGRCWKRNNRNSITNSHF